jgi:hypothetical protein
VSAAAALGAEIVASYILSLVLFTLAAGTSLAAAAAAAAAAADTAAAVSVVTYATAFIADVKHHVYKRLPSYIGMTVAGASVPPPTLAPSPCPRTDIPLFLARTTGNPILQLPQATC